MEIQQNTPLAMLTVGQLQAVLQAAFGNVIEQSLQKEEENGEKYVYGVRELAKLLGCSVSTAQRRVGSGLLDNCIIRNGRLLIFDREKVLSTLKGGAYESV